MENQKPTLTDWNEWIVNYLTGSISQEQLVLLHKWINASNENREIFLEQRQAWILAGLDDGKLTKEAEKAYERLLVKRDGIMPANRDDQRIHLWKYLRIAATWILFILAGSGATWFLAPKSDYRYRSAVTVAVPLGAKSCVTLPDGSTVWLNAGTRLTYNEDFGKQKRTLMLTGEAFFDVAEDKEHPFIVHASDMIIRALGTKFNVKAYPEEKTITTTLVEGKIDVRIIRSKHQVRNIVLLPNEEIVYFEPGYRQKVEKDSPKDMELRSIAKIDPGKFRVISHIDAKSNTSWKDDRWVIDRKPLGYLVPLLERRYNLKIFFNDEELKSFNFTGIIQNETAEQIMHALSLTAPLSYHISNDTVILNMNVHQKDHFNEIMEPRN